MTRTRAGSREVELRQDDLKRIRQALAAAMELVRSLDRAPMVVEFKRGPREPVTLLDRRINELLLERLPRCGEGWLSEETRDDLKRLQKGRVWVVDPLDGTREFIRRIPEWCVSIGLVENGRAVAGGVCNPSTRETFLGAVGLGVSRNGQPARVRRCPDPRQALVLASRNELARGEWSGCTRGRFRVQPCGSVAYKLARVAAGLADATWTYAPKHEWDVAAGAALIAAAGGIVRTLDGNAPTFNRRVPRFEGLAAFSSFSHAILEPIALSRMQSMALSGANARLCG